MYSLRTCLARQILRSSSIWGKASPAEDGSSIYSFQKRRDKSFGRYGSDGEAAAVKEALLLSPEYQNTSAIPTTLKMNPFERIPINASLITNESTSGETTLEYCLSCCPRHVDQPRSPGLSFLSARHSTFKVIIHPYLSRARTTIRRCPSADITARPTQALTPIGSFPDANHENL